MLASMAGHDSVVEALLEAGTPWNALDKDGNCAGDLAMLAGHQSTTDLLLEAGPHLPHESFTCSPSDRGSGKRNTCLWHVPLHFAWLLRILLLLTDSYCR